MPSLLKENIIVSLDSIRTHMLRSTLTILIIAFGITALVGILTSIDAIKFFLNRNFTMMGANTFTIRNKETRMEGGERQSLAKNFRVIDWQEAQEFKDRYDFPAKASIFMYATRTSTLKFESRKTNPNIPVVGTDENYLLTSGYEVERGRHFSNNEVQYGAHVAVIGSDVASKLFPGEIDPLEKIISVGPAKYVVIGILKSKGSSMTDSDNICLLPVTNVRSIYAQSNTSFRISVLSNDPMLLDAAIGEARGLMRNIRGVRSGEEDSFDISKSDNLASMLYDNLQYLRFAATAIGVITLFGAAIGLMNIMLVSVTERTAEIGIRKAIGATSKTIRDQFLMEAIVIGQLGGLAGIIMGVGIGNVLSLIIGAGFIIPWLWIISGVLICFIVAVVSGLIPALKAARLDPVESLRYE